jgi:hypothetical protein
MRRCSDVIASVSASAPAAWASSSRRTIPSSIDASPSSSCIPILRARRKSNARDCCAKHRRWRACRIRTSSPSTTWGASASRCSSRSSWSKARPSLVGSSTERVARDRRTRSCACSSRPVAVSQPRTRSAWCTEISSPTTCSSVAMAARASPTSASPNRSIAPMRRASPARCRRYPRAPATEEPPPGRSSARRRTCRASSSEASSPMRARINSRSASRCTKRSSARARSSGGRSRSSSPTSIAATSSRRRRARHVGCGSSSSADSRCARRIDFRTWRRCSPSSSAIADARDASASPRSEWSAARRRSSAFSPSPATRPLRRDDAPTGRAHRDLRALRRARRAPASVAARRLRIPTRAAAPRSSITSPRAIARRSSST